jgi:hypothetical protein
VFKSGLVHIWTGHSPAINPEDHAGLVFNRNDGTHTVCGDQLAPPDSTLHVTLSDSEEVGGSINVAQAMKRWKGAVALPLALLVHLHEKSAIGVVSVREYEIWNFLRTTLPPSDVLGKLKGRSVDFGGRHAPHPCEDAVDYGRKQTLVCQDAAGGIIAPILWQQQPGQRDQDSV